MTSIPELAVGPLQCSRSISHTYYLNKYVALPDVLNSGPVVGYQMKSALLPGSTGHAAKFVSRKQMHRPPWHPSVPCCVPCCTAAPINRPPLPPTEEHPCWRRGSLLTLAGSASEPCLWQAVNSVEGSTVLLYNVIEQGTLSNLSVRLKCQRNIQLRDVSAQEMNNESYLLMRAYNQVDIARLNNHSLEYCNEEVQFKDTITSACMQVNSPGCWLQCSELEKVSLYSAEYGRTAVWSQQIPNMAGNMLHGGWCSAVFTYGPDCAVAANRTSVYRVDLRTTSLQPLLHTCDVTEAVNQDDICCLAPVPNRPYLFCVQGEHVLLLDERMCQIPVLAWQHGLTGDPCRTSVITGNQDLHMLAITTNAEQRVCVIGIRGCSTLLDTLESHVSSASLTTHFDMHDPMVAAAHYSGLWLDAEVQARLGQDLTGIAWCGTASEEQLGVFVSNVLGDVYWQGFTLNLDCGDQANLSTDIDSNVTERLKSWEEDILAMPTTFASEGRFNLVHRVNSFSTKKVNKRSKIRNYLSKCTHLKNEHWDVLGNVVKHKNSRRHKQVLSNKQKLNWTDILVDLYKVDFDKVAKRKLLHVPAGPIKEHLSGDMCRRMSIEHVQSCTDIMAHIIRKHWTVDSLVAAPHTVTLLGDEEEEEVEWYRSAPYSGKVSSVCAPPAKCKLRSGSDGSTPAAKSVTSSPARRSSEEEMGQQSIHDITHAMQLSTLLVPTPSRGARISGKKRCRNEGF